MIYRNRLGRAFARTVAFAVSMLALTALPASVQPEAPSWVPQIEGWTLLTSTEAPAPVIYIFVRIAPSPNQNRRFWIRSELAEPSATPTSFTYSSVVSLEESDCAAHRTAIVQTTLYASNGMTGQTRGSTYDDLEFRSPNPGSILEGTTNWICSQPASEVSRPAPTT